MSSRLLASLACVLACATLSIAQAPPPDDLPPPQTAKPATARVRITLTTGKVVTGLLLDHGKRSYRVRLKGGVLVLREDQVRELVFVVKDRINVDVSDMPLAEVMAQISREVGKTIAVGKAAKGELVSVSLREIPWRMAVDVIARMTRCDVEVIGESLFLTQRPRVTIDFRYANLRTIVQLMAAYSGRSAVMGPKVRGSISANLHNVRYLEALRAVAWVAGLDLAEKNHIARLTVRSKGRAPAPAPAKDTRPKKPSPRVTLDLVNVELSDALEQIGKLAGRNLLTDPSAEGKVTLSMRNATVDEVVKLVARQCGCVVRDHGNGVMVLSQPPKNVLRAEGVPAAAWFIALAQRAHVNLLVAPEVTARIKTDLSGVFLEDAIEQTAMAYGYRVVRFPKSNILAVVGKRFDPDAKITGIKVGDVLPQPKKLPTLKPAQRKEIGERIDGLFTKIETLAMKQDVEGLIAAFGEVRTLMKRYGTGGGPEFRSALARWEKRMANMGEVTISLRLQAYIHEGNQLLRAMAAAIKSNDAGAALGTYAQLEQLVSEMNKEERAVFKRNAAALDERGRSLMGRALKGAGVLRIDAKTGHRPRLEAVLWSKLDRQCVILGVGSFARETPTSSLTEKNWRGSRSTRSARTP
jgi:hypothetical protein